MTEIEKIQYARGFIDKLANGINPLNNTAIPENEVINNVRIARCMFYVSDLLRRLADNGGIIQKPKPTIPFAITVEQLSKYPFSDTPVTVSRMAENINSLIDTENMKPLSYKDITQWLMNLKLLQEEIGHDGKKVKRPTEEAGSFGISVEERQGHYRIYHVVVYDRKAQEFIIHNMQSILRNKYSGDGQ